jgi:integrase
MPGFGVRVRSTKTVYVVQYRFQKVTQRESLGDVRKLKVEEARKVTRQFFAKIELGVDPRDEKRKATRAAESAKLTLKAVSELYLTAKETKMRPSTYKASKDYFEVKWSPLHRKPIGGIDRKAVAEQIRRITAEHGATSAARARGNLSALYAWAMREGLVEANPVVGTNNPIEGKPGRDRVLSDVELELVWQHCLDDDFGRVVRLLLLTACRRDEIGGLRWPEVDLQHTVAFCCRRNVRSPEGPWNCRWYRRRKRSLRERRNGWGENSCSEVASADFAPGPGASSPWTSG